MDNKIEPFGRMNSTPIFGKLCVCGPCVIRLNGLISLANCKNPSLKEPIGYTNLNPEKYPLISYRGNFYHFEGKVYKYIEYVYLNDNEFIAR